MSQLDPQRVPVDPKLFASLERAALDRSLGGVRLALGPGAAAAVMSQDPAALDQKSLALARTANTLLPAWRFDGAQLGVLKRQQMSVLPTFVANVGNSLRVLGLAGVSFPAKDAQLLDLMKRRGLFAGFNLLGMQITNIGLDQRQLTGAFLVFLIDRLVTAIDRRFQDPRVPQAAKDKLLKDFGPALLDLDEVLRSPQVRKEELQARRRTLQQETADAQAEAEMKDAAMRLRQRMVLPREVLFSAARRFQQVQQQAPAAVAQAPRPTPPAPAGGPAKITR